MKCKALAVSADGNVTEAVNRKFQPLVGKPLDTEKIESLLADIRADGRYDADYTVGYPDQESNQPNGEQDGPEWNDRIRGVPVAEVNLGMRVHGRGGAEV